MTDPGAYGQSFSETYDTWYSTVTDANATAQFVAARTQGRIVLELGAGTGRLATALQRVGLDVIGLDASAEMLRLCPTEICRLLADMAHPPLRLGSNVTALCGFNTVFNLTSEQLQRLMFQQLRPVAQTLIFETAVLAPTEPGDIADSQVGVKERRPDSVVVTATSSDDNNQTVVGSHLEIANEGVLARPWMLRWATLAQLDDMADEAGFRLTERYSTWDGSPWSADSKAPIAISVYQ